MSTTSSSRFLAPNSTSTRSWSCSRWAFSAPGANALLEQAEVELDPRGNVEGQHQLDYKTKRGAGVFLRRHAARPVARRLGDPRRPPMRPQRRRIPDGDDEPAEVGKASSSPRRLDVGEQLRRMQKRQRRTSSGDLLSVEGDAGSGPLIILKASQPLVILSNRRPGRKRG